MLTQKALNKKLTATLCTTTNTIFVHKNNKAHLQYTVNSEKVIHNANAQQLQAFYKLPSTVMQKTKNFNKLINTNLLSNYLLHTKKLIKHLHFICKCVTILT